MKIFLAELYLNLRVFNIYLSCCFRCYQNVSILQFFESAINQNRLYDGITSNYDVINKILPDQSDCFIIRTI